MNIIIIIIIIITIIIIIVIIIIIINILKYAYYREHWLFVNGIHTYWLKFSCHVCFSNSRKLRSPECI